MKYQDPARILWLEREIQILTNPDSYLHKQQWQLGGKKDKHPLSDRLVSVGKRFSTSKGDNDKVELLSILEELKLSIQPIAV